MIPEAKKLLENIIKAAVPGITVVKSAADETREIMARNFPLVSLITNPGSFDGSGARTVRYDDRELKQRKERYVRGHRNLPILIRCWEKGEEEADALVSAIIPEIPSQWEYDGFGNHVQIGAEEHSDHAGSMGKPYVSVIEVIFTGTAARKPAEVPVFETSEMQGGEIAGHKKS